jgi:hypothetical protein
MSNRLRPSRSTVAAVCLTALVVASVGMSALPATAQFEDSAAVTISDVTASTETPTAGEPFSLEVTISNLEGSRATTKIESLRVRIDGTQRYVTRDIGRLPPGSETTVTVPVRVDDPGQTTIQLEVSGETDNGLVDSRTPFVVDVRDAQKPRVSAAAFEASSGPAQGVNVTVANGIGRPVENVVVSVDSFDEAVTFEETTRVLGRMNQGSTLSFRFPAQVDATGEYRTEVTLSYAVSGREREVTRVFSITMREPRRPGVSVSVPDAVTGASRNVSVTVANGIGRSVDNVAVSVASSAAEVDFGETTRVLGRMDRGTTRSFRFPARVAAAGEYPLTVTVSYTDGSRQQEFTRTFETRFGEPSNPGRVILSGVEATQRGSSIELSATASNVGGTDVGGVVVAVNRTEAVRPQTYFVGGVDASGFSTFTLQTSATGQVSSIPVEVTYVTSGVERSFVTDVAVDSVATPQADRQRSGSGLPLGTLGLAVVGVAVLVGAVVLYRRRG